MISIKNIVLGIAIFLLMMFVAIYGIRAVYGKGPQYDEFCKQSINFNQTNCEDAGGKWVNNSQYVADQRGAVKVVPAEGGSCNYDYDKCNKDFQNANEIYTKKVFFIAAPLGVIIIAVGALIFGLEFVGAGLMAGGVGVIFYGVMGYWQYTSDWLKFIILLIGLVVVIWIGYYLNKKLRKKKEHEEMK